MQRCLEKSATEHRAHFRDARSHGTRDRRDLRGTDHHLEQPVGDPASRAAVAAAMPGAALVRRPPRPRSARARRGSVFRLLIRLARFHQLPAGRADDVRRAGAAAFTARQASSCACTCTGAWRARAISSRSDSCARHCGATAGKYLPRDVAGWLVCALLRNARADARASDRARSCPGRRAVSPGSSFPRGCDP